MPENKVVINFFIFIIYLLKIVTLGNYIHQSISTLPRFHKNNFATDSDSLALNAGTARAGAFPSLSSIVVQDHAVQRSEKR